ncbi:MAG TPA: glycosyltransferase [Lacunisphaera sp.]|nr:glycosyltransferase [Lacunisphaera sp.]
MSPTAPAPRVVAGITTRNRAGILPRALDSLRQSSWPGLRINVLDDASTDATPGLAGQYPEVAWRRHERPAGIIACRNELMQAADADYFVCLDDDAWFVAGDELALAIAHLEANRDVAAVAFDILSPDRPDPVARGTPRPVAMFIGCGHVLRLADVRAAGYYASAPGIYGSEEKDLCLRLADRNRRVDLLPGVHVWHDKAWAARDWFPLHRSGVCNELAMTVRLCPLPDLIAVLPLKLASFAAYWLRQPRFLRAGVAGTWDCARHLPAVWRHRRPVQRATFWRFRRFPS